MLINLDALLLFKNASSRENLRFSFFTSFASFHQRQLDGFVLIQNKVLILNTEVLFDHLLKYWKACLPLWDLQLFLVFDADYSSSAQSFDSRRKYSQDLHLQQLFTSPLLLHRMLRFLLFYSTLLIFKLNRKRHNLLIRRQVLPRYWLIPSSLHSTAIRLCIE